ncbi:MAG: molybdopterin-dependent oxidoreductase [Deltaproteobacteria bacterium]|jgi:4-hydroxybenzoyl-CoA reductase alpha subunit|nr:molybdopterin-dependent oxidoreductase [Deltaproteobacteria bacterium]
MAGDNVYHCIGRGRPRTDSLAKVTGAAQFTADIPVHRCLVGKILRSPHAHARILSIDTQRAKALPGVKAVVTGVDAPVKYGILPVSQDEYPLAVEKVRFVGDEVAAVAAVDEATALRALELIEVTYEVLPVILDPHEALVREDVKIHERAVEANIERRVHLVFGDLEQAFAEADYIREDRFFKEAASHAFLEPHSALAQYQDGKLTLWSSTQVPHYVHRSLSSVLRIPMEKIRVIKPALGGGFGGKGEPLPLEFAASLLAMKTGRPVRVIHSREEVFLTHRGRHPMEMTLKTGVKQDGTITAVQFSSLLDGGAYGSYGVVTMIYSGQLLTAPYRVPAYAFDSVRVFTNKPPCGAQRGHGGVQPRFAFEVHLDRIAADLGIDPLEIRRRNAIEADTVTVNELRITSCAFKTCLDRVAETVDWKNKHGKLPYGKGVGLAGGFYVTGAAYPIYANPMPHSQVQIRVDRNGGVTVFSGASDIGQGSDTLLVMITAETLGIPETSVRVVSADTEITPVDLGSYSSRVTFMAGNACHQAALEIRDRLLAVCAKELERNQKDLRFREGHLFAKEAREPLMTFAEASVLGEASGVALCALGSYRPPELAGSYKLGGVGPSPAYSFGAQAAEVEVDTETGEIRVVKIHCAHDLGFALNPLAASGQAEGAVVMGFGEAVLEHHGFSPGGRHNGPTFLDYKIPTCLDVPDVDVTLVESIDPAGPYGAKEIGEGSLHPSLPAIVNALYDAVGCWFHDLPLTAERVLAALDHKETPS